MIVVLVILGIYLIVKTPGMNNNSGLDENKNEESSAKGRVVFSVTDAAANMSTISEITVKISRVDIHSDVDGWSAVSITPKSYDLLALDASGESKILADIQTKAEVYDQIRLVIDSVSVKTKAGATKEATVPGNQFVLDTILVVDGSSTSSVNLDFLADKSLHTTSSGQYVFAPVVKTETKSKVTANIDASGTVILIGGKTDESSTAGMDLSGTVRANFELDTNQKIELDTDNMIKIDGNALLK